jgi:pimeloyl-ACP methyl ester carboxylesterase
MKDVAIAPDGVPIHFQVQGAGAPALVFVHGWCCNRGYWEEQLGHFARQYQVVAVDLAGHGESGLQRDAWTMPAFGGDVAAVVEKLELDQVVLIGHSMGGPVIVEAARRIPHRVTGLVGVDTWRTLGYIHSEQEIANLLAPFRANFPETAAGYVRQMFIPSSDPALAERIVSQMAAAPPAVAIGAMEANRRNDQNLMAGLRELKAPVIAINSDYRPCNVAAAEELGIKLAFMSGVGHFVMMEDAGTFNRLLADAIEEVTSARAAT